MLEDRVYRSLGLLQSARILSAGEFMASLSNLRWGLSWEWWKGLGFRIHVNSLLLVYMQPANLILHDAAAEDPAVRDRERAARREHRPGARPAEQQDAP